MNAQTDTLERLTVALVEGQRSAEVERLLDDLHDSASRIVAAVNRYKGRETRQRVTCPQCRRERNMERDKSA